MRISDWEFRRVLFRSPARFVPQDVPMDPYALGVLLGDGCITGRTTPSFTTADPELAWALEELLPESDVVPRRTSAVDHVIRRRPHVPGSTNPVKIGRASCRERVCQYV